MHFPLKMKPREKQLEALEFTKKSINRGFKYIMMNLPTGTGKSYYTIMFANWYRNFVSKDAKFDIITNSKFLQDQYMSDYPFISNFKGRANYTCDPHDTNCSLGYETCKVIGPKCGLNCPYEASKGTWKSADIGLTNFHMFNTCAIYAKNILGERESKVLIIDEAHEIEPVFTSYISIAFSAKSMKKYGFTLAEIEKLDRRLNNIKSIAALISFIESFREEVALKRDHFEGVVKSKKRPQKINQEYAKYIEHCDSQMGKMEFLVTEYNDDKNNWTLDISKNEKDMMYSGILLEAKPIWGHKYMYDYIYSKYDHIIFMSATLEKSVFSFINGIDPDKSTFFETDSPFPLKNRPVYYMKVGKMSYTTKEETMKKQIVQIRKIMDKYADSKGIIHCSSYDVSRFIMNNMKSSRFLFHDSENREEILNMHINSVKPTVLVSVNMESGIDLHGDRSRFQIVCKVPYPFLGSQNIKARQSDMPAWYSVETVSKLIQSCGRSVRSETDYADTYILDSNFSDLLRYSSDYFPHWFMESVIPIQPL